MRTDYAALEGLIVIQSRRIKAMQRKIDRYKKYARIKHRKEQKPPRVINISPDIKLPKTLTILNLPARFVKMWRVGE